MKLQYHAFISVRWYCFVINRLLLISLSAISIPNSTLIRVLHFSEDFYTRQRFPPHVRTSFQIQTFFFFTDTHQHRASFSFNENLAKFFRQGDLQKTIFIVWRNAFLKLCENRIRVKLNEHKDVHRDRCIKL